MKRLVKFAGLSVLLAAGAFGQMRGFGRGGFGSGGFGRGGLVHRGFVGGGRIGFGHGFGHFGFQSGFRGFIGGPGFGFGFGRFPVFHGFVHRRFFSPFFQTPFFSPWAVWPAFGGGYAYPYPVFGGGYAYPYGGYGPYPQSPNVIIVYPPAPSAPAPSGPEIISSQSEVRDDAADAPKRDPVFFLIPLKDHSVHSAVAYWVEGDALHFVTTQGKHDQVAIEAVDRAVSEKLNEGREIRFRLPAAKD